MSNAEFVERPSAHNGGVGTVNAITLTPLFKLVFLTVLGLTLVALILNVCLVALIGSPNEQAKSLIELCSTIVKTGLATIVGLIGGKAA